MIHRTRTGQRPKPRRRINRGGLVSVVIPCITTVGFTMECRERLALEYRAALLQAELHLQHVHLDMRAYVLARRRRRRAPKKKVVVQGQAWYWTSSAVWSDYNQLMVFWSPIRPAYILSVASVTCYIDNDNDNIITCMAPSSSLKKSSVALTWGKSSS